MNDAQRSDAELAKTIYNRYESTKNKMAHAAKKVGRDISQIQLIAASKVQNPESLRELIDAGHTVFGENRFQEGRAKIPLLPSLCVWHFIGGLQRNKVKDIVKLFEWIHSVDSQLLLDEVDKRAATIGKIQKILLEVNIADEASKHGASPYEVKNLVIHANQLANVEVNGLMTVAPFYDDLEEVRPFFKQLADLKKEVELETGSILPHLSMGMTHDFEIAIEEGATMVRVGTGLFGPRRAK
ncbi:MAG: YggS family pyridoxal phosphate-dependent enzyme [Verrucomicrobiota bacterium]